jgi:hypothetical protein
MSLSSVSIKMGRISGPCAFQDFVTEENHSGDTVKLRGIIQTV